MEFSVIAALFEFPGKTPKTQKLILACLIPSLARTNDFGVQLSL
jgi:hypothetical protein